MIIEGDNLEVLRVLRKAYAGRVKLIYIDPPYNTGNDFVYKDDFSDPVERYLELTGQAGGEGLRTSNPKTAGRYHSNWLNMMYPRLRLARELLRNDGVMFISIDDNELMNLRALMDEIFGAENFLATVCWQKKYAPANDKIDFSYTHEYVVVYCKNKKYSDSGKAEALLNKMGRSEENNKAYKNPDDDPEGDWKPGDYTCAKTAEQRPNLYYPIEHPKTGEQIWPSRTRVWAYSEDRHKENLRQKRVFWGVSQENKVPSYKRYLKEMGGIVSDTWWEHEDVGHTDEAKKEFRALFPDAGDAFDTPKPTRLMKRILELATDPHEDHIVLDFFAGSGTMGQAVMDQNAVDEGSRRFVLVQVPEPTPESSAARSAGLLTIAEVTKERVRRTIKKLQEAGLGANGDLGFQVFKLHRTNVKAWRSVEDGDMTKLRGQLFDRVSSLVEGWTPEGARTETMLVEGHPLDSKLERLTDFSENEVWCATHPELNTQLLMCFDKDIQSSTVQALSDYDDAVFVCQDTALSDTVKQRIADTLKVKTL